MDPQEIEVDSVADLRVALEDNVDLDTVRDIAEGEMLPAPEDAAGDLGYPDASTPSQTTDSVSATAGTSPGRSSGLLSCLLYTSPSPRD